MTCDGDAIQCAIAAEQQKRNCQWYDDYSKSAKDKGDQLQALAGQAQPDGHPGRDQSVLETSTLIRDSDLLGGGSCPVDQVLTVATATVTLPFGQLCGPLQMLGNLLTGVAYLAGAFILFKRGK